jgi:predicted O-methyltransferase YrrM
MIDKIMAILEYLKYQKNAKTKYYLHSPFYYQFFLNILEKNEIDEKTTTINTIVGQLKKQKQLIEIQDFGAKKGVYKKSVAAIAKNVIIPDKYGKVLTRAVHYFQPKTIVELGTSLGISSSYMAVAAHSAAIISFEGAPAVVSIAKKNHAQLQLKNIEIVEGDFVITLAERLATISQIDLAYIDANHTYEATMAYFHLLKQKISENSVLIFDDIYWSKGMQKAWQEIQKEEAVTTTIDIYKMGFVFFKKDKLAKQHIQLRY